MTKRRRPWAAVATASLIGGAAWLAVPATASAAGALPPEAGGLTVSIQAPVGASQGNTFTRFHVTTAAPCGAGSTQIGVMAFGGNLPDTGALMETSVGPSGLDTISTTGFDVPRNFDEVNGTYGVSQGTGPFRIQVICYDDFNTEFGTSTANLTFDTTTHFALQASAQPSFTGLVATPANSAVQGGPVTLTAHVTSSGTVAGGTVAFEDGSTTLGSVTVNAAGDAVFTTTALGQGAHSLRARFAGVAGQSTTSSSSNLAYSITAPPSSTTTLAASPLTKSVQGNTVTLTAHVASSGAVAGGSVTFKDGPTALGTGVVDSTGNAVFTSSTLTVGAHALSASFAGVFSHAAPSSSGNLTYTITAAPSSTTTVAASPATTAREGVAVTVTAHVVSTGTVTGGTVTFKDGATTLGTAAVNASGNAVFTTTALAVGSRTLSASFAGVGGQSAPSSSSNITYTITPAPASTTTLVASPVGTSPLGSAVTLTAHVVSTGTVAGGTVTFKDGSASLGSVAVNAAGDAVLTTTALPGGVRTLTASFSGVQAQSAASASSGLSYTISALSTSTVLNAPATAVAGASVTLTSTVSPSGASGSVEFFDGTTSLGAAPVSSGVASKQAVLATAGTRAVTAVFTPTDAASYLASTSSAASVVVSAPVVVASTPSPQPLPTKTATPSPSPSASPTTTPTTTPTTPPTTPPVPTKPRLKVAAKLVGRPLVGQTVVCVATFSKPSTLKFAWTRDGKPVKGTSAKRKFAKADLKHIYVCKVTARNTVGSTASSTKKVKIGPPAVVASRKPVISGKAVLKAKLTVSTGTWKPVAVTYRYQWLRDGKAISGARANTYVITAKDRKHAISCLVTTTHKGFSPGMVVTSALKVK